MVKTPTHFTILTQNTLFDLKNYVLEQILNHSLNFEPISTIISQLNSKFCYATQCVLKEVPQGTFYFDEKHILKLFPPTFCQYVSTIPGKKNCILLTFIKHTFCKDLYRENDGPST